MLFPVKEEVGVVICQALTVVKRFSTSFLDYYVLYGIPECALCRGFFHHKLHCTLFH